MFLKLGEAAKLFLGPFVDATDGFTPETGLDITTVDSALIFKHNALSSSSIAARTFTHVAGGFYSLNLVPDDVDTEGRLVIFLRDDSVCRPKSFDFTVLSELAYDAIVGGSFLGESFVGQRHSLKAIKDKLEVISGRMIR